MMTDTLADALGVIPLSDAIVEQQVPTVEEPDRTEKIFKVTEEYNTVHADQDAHEDFLTAQRSTREALDTGVLALSEILNVAKLSENPRAYEVVATMVKTVAEAADSLLQLHKTRKEISVPAGEKSGTNITNNTLVMTTAEALKLLRSGSGLPAVVTEE